MADPFTDFRDALRSSERLSGVKIELGPAHLPSAGAPPRIVIVPVGGPVEVAENADNVADELCELACVCWASNYLTLWALRSALVQAAGDYRFATEINVQFRRVEFPTDPDATQQGLEATVVLLIRAPLAIVALEGAEGFGDVEAVQFTAVGGTGDGTVTLIEEE